jgi:hypothetical protein
MGSGEVIRYRLTLKFEGLKLVNINTDGISSLPKLTFIRIYTKACFFLPTP